MAGQVNIVIRFNMVEVQEGEGRPSESLVNSLDLAYTLDRRPDQKTGSNVTKRLWETDSTTRIFVEPPTFVLIHQYKGIWEWSG